jgi:hypothetical protein
MLHFYLYGGHALEQIFILSLNGFVVTTAVEVKDESQRRCRRGPTGLLDAVVDARKSLIILHC